eukprot:scaffold8184_cov134-Isochrysis_galbana.AAC.2
MPTSPIRATSRATAGAPAPPTSPPGVKTPPGAPLDGASHGEEELGGGDVARLGPRHTDQHGRVQAGGGRRRRAAARRRVGRCPPVAYKSGGEGGGGQALLGGTSLRRGSEREEARVAQQHCAAQPARGQSVEHGAGGRHDRGPNRALDAKGGAKLRREVRFTRRPGPARQHALGGADHGGVRSGESEGVFTELFVPARPCWHAELGPESRRRAARPGILLLQLSLQSPALAARFTDGAETVHCRVEGGGVRRRTARCARHRLIHVEAVIHLRVRTDGRRPELHRREQGADVGRHRVEGAGVHDEDAGGGRGRPVLERAPVDELGLSAQIGVVALLLDAGLDDSLAVESVRARSIEHEARSEAHGAHRPLVAHLGLGAAGDRPPHARPRAVWRGHLLQRARRELAREAGGAQEHHVEFSALGRGRHQNSVHYFSLSEWAS